MTTGCFDLNCGFIFVGKPDKPEVYLIAPPDSTDQVTLTCYVKNFYPKEVAVSWLVDDELVERRSDYKQNITSALENDKSFSVYSQLVFSGSDWESGKVFTCRVYHESLEDPERLISRSISKSPNTATIMHLALHAPPVCSGPTY